MEKGSKIYVAGHRGLVGSALLRCLKNHGFNNLLVKTHKDLDLTDQRAVREFFLNEKPEHVFLAAAKVGGIMANNTFRAMFIYENLMIQSNVIHEAYRNKVKKLLFLGSTCVYPGDCPQPIKESYLLTSKLEKTNEPYAIAKIAGIKMCESYNQTYNTNFIAVMPTNLYGLNDNYDLNNSHVLPALIRKTHEAKISGTKKITIWGTGKPQREFLFSEDLAEACLFLMDHYQKNEIINIGTGEDLTIKELAQMVCEIIGFKGDLIFDISKPDGTFRKISDVSKIQALGWRPKISLKEGIRISYDDFLARKENLQNI